MPGVYLGNADSRDLPLETQIATVGQRVVADFLADILAAYEEQFADIRAQLIGPASTEFALRLDREASGMYLQRGDEYSRPDATRMARTWDVLHYPIWVFQRRVSWTRYFLAQASVGELLSTQQMIAHQDTNTLIREALRAVLTKENYTFKDMRHGSLTIRPLLNGDGFDPPDYFNNTFDGNHTHYFGANGTNAAAVDAGFLTMKNHLREHGYFGDLVAWVDPTIEDEVRAATNFKQRVDPYVIIPPGSTTEFAVLTDPDAIGRLHDFQVIVKPYMPTNYVLGFDRANGPLLRERIHEVNEFRGLKIVAREAAFPLEDVMYERWVGYGVNNRISGVAMQVVASTTYTSPTFSEE